MVSSNSLNAVTTQPLIRPTESNQLRVVYTVPEKGKSYSLKAVGLDSYAQMPYRLKYEVTLSEEREFIRTVMQGYTYKALSTMICYLLHHNYLLRFKEILL